MNATIQKPQATTSVNAAAPMSAQPPPRRPRATRVARGLRGGGWALIGAAAFTLVVAWGFWMVAFTQWVARVDS
ncbi:MAG TPA: hypothetical protein VM287_02385 [Egibacteraceae bacterium]|nr:hypothetical protein [Egibacteraceae bacterium]